MEPDLTWTWKEPSGTLTCETPPGLMCKGMSSAASSALCWCYIDRRFNRLRPKGIIMACAFSKEGYRRLWQSVDTWRARGWDKPEQWGLLVWHYSFSNKIQEEERVCAFSIRLLWAFHCSRWMWCHWKAQFEWEDYQDLFIAVKVHQWNYIETVLNCIEILFLSHILRVSVTVAPHTWCHLNLMKIFLFNSNFMFPVFIVKSTKTLFGMLRLCMLMPKDQCSTVEIFNRTSSWKFSNSAPLQGQRSYGVISGITCCQHWSCWIFEKYPSNRPEIIRCSTARLTFYVIALFPFNASVNSERGRMRGALN